MIASAPGKLVLWGEYAVLAGAPAAVMAVNRRATVQVKPAPAWQFTSSGLPTAGVYCGTGEFTETPTAGTAEAVLRHLGYGALPQPAMRVHSATEDFFNDGVKLGLGSSAAICAATTAAFGHQLRHAVTLDDALAVHHRLQGGGSGLDVAASWHGGVIRFERTSDAVDVTATTLPDNLCWQVVFTGTPAVTAAHVSNFNAWRESQDNGVLEVLADASSALFSASRDLSAWRRYITALGDLDAAAGLNIFTQEHAQLATIAAAHGLVYKPCGAGGGDIGIAVGDEPAAVTAFTAAASAQNFVPLDLEIATDGVRLSDHQP